MHVYSSNGEADNRARWRIIDPPSPPTAVNVSNSEIAKTAVSGSGQKATRSPCWSSSCMFVWLNLNDLSALRLCMYQVRMYAGWKRCKQNQQQVFFWWLPVFLLAFSVFPFTCFFLYCLSHLLRGGTTAILPLLLTKHERRGWPKQEGDGRQGSKVPGDYSSILLRVFSSLVSFALNFGILPTHALDLSACLFVL